MGTEPVTDLHLPTQSSTPRTIPGAWQEVCKGAECSVQVGEMPKVPASPWSEEPEGAAFHRLALEALVVLLLRESHVEEQRRPTCSHSEIWQCDILPGGPRLPCSHREQPAPGGAVGFWDPLSHFESQRSVSQFVRCNPQNAGKETHAREKGDGWDLINP